MLGHVTGTSTYFDDHKLQGMLHLKVLRQPARACPPAPHRHHERRNARPAYGASFAAPTCRASHTLPQPDQFRKDDEPSLAVDKVRYRRADRRCRRDSPREAFEAIAKVRVDYEPLLRYSTSRRR